MRRVAAIVVALVAGAAGGAAATAALQDSASPAAIDTTTMTPETAPVPTAAPAPDEPDVLLAWAQGGLPVAAIEAARSAAGGTSVSVVHDGRVDLVASFDAGGAPVDEVVAGWRIPLDAIAVDPADHAGVAATADANALLLLGPGDALLGETSAVLRRLGPGGRLELADGTSLTIVAVVPDEAVGAAEVVVDVDTGAALGIDTPRAMLIAHGGDRAAVEAAVAAATDRPVRFRAPGETPYLRAADAVLPQAIVKASYGEFSYQPAGGDDVLVDPAWVAANIVEVEVPVLGTVRCHRLIVDVLAAAMAEVDDAGLAGPVQAAGFDGCFVPRTTRTGGSISRHAWGTAFDIGYGENPTGAASTQRDRLVEILQRAGFTWGGTWLVPDAAHFEIVRPTR